MKTLQPGAMAVLPSPLGRREGDEGRGGSGARTLSMSGSLAPAPLPAGERSNQYDR